MAKRASQEREQFWRDLIGRQPASGLSIVQFCRQVGVSANSFFVWKRRVGPRIGQALRAKQTSRAGSLGRSTRSNELDAAAGALVPVRLIADPVGRNAPNPGAIEVQWPDGLVLRVPSGFDAGSLRDVLHALQLATDAEAPSC